jgi:mono/diheme cytochrome c family protein
LGPTTGIRWRSAPETGLVYIPAQELALDFTTDANFVARPGRWNLGTVQAPLPDDPAVRAAIKTASKGFLIAWDAANAREAWRVEHKGPWNGGTLATAGGLVFEGTVDGRFVALDARTGKELWGADHHVSTLAGPMTYAVNGEQYVAALSGFGSVFNLTSAAISPIQPSRVNGRVHVYKIGGSATASSPTATAVAVREPPKINAPARDVARGAALYGQYCMMCHGFGAVGGAISDIRLSRRLEDAAAWREAVVNGALAGAGMPRFAGDISESDAEMIRAYVARQAAAAYAQQKPGS